jgi:ABC-type proline/glycine betaine transport system permease subunit
MEDLEFQTAAAEARRLRADQAVATLHKDQKQMVSAGKKHAALIVKWWLWGLLLGWLLAIIVSALVSPVLAFMVVIPILAIFLTVGYASSSVEMKVGRETGREGGGRPCAKRDAWWVPSQRLGGLVEPSLDNPTPNLNPFPSTTVLLLPLAMTRLLSTFMWLGSFPTLPARPAAFLTLHAPSCPPLTSPGSAFVSCV